MFIDRRKRGGTYLQWRARLLGIGAVLALVGIATGREWVINVAIGVLVLGFGLRFLEGRDVPEEAEEDEEEDGELRT